MKTVVLSLIFFLFSYYSFAQDISSKRTKKITLSTDTIYLDTLSIVPESIIITTSSGNKIDSTFYKTDAAKGLIVFIKPLSDNIKDSISIEYKVFPFSFSKPVQHKKIESISKETKSTQNPFTYVVNKETVDPFKTEGLNKSGSISRGISFGNNQDVALNSNLNLQVSGKLNNNIELLLAATDDNIPIQPEGNTQQLQEFDKVFIQLSTQNSRLIAGDFQLLRPNSYFLNYNKKAQGISFNTRYKVNPEKKDTMFQGLSDFSMSAAVSRGKFARNLIQGVESNQGPYRLRGAENEQFIIVLSGTERVYLDGVLLQRGQEYDYIIDYNTAEITFTAKQLITKDKRIIVEFQYSDKNYARSLVQLSNNTNLNKVKLRFNVFSEQDSKNQPLQQDLNTEQKLLLANAGDNLFAAVTPSFDSVEFNAEEVLYRKADTIFNAVLYPDVFIYSTNPLEAHFRVSFSNVGQGNGNYRQIITAANGRVFQWFAPIGGIKQGNYEPVILLIAPKKKQMATAAGDYFLKKNTKLSVETALSKNDINTFSEFNSRDDEGYAMKFNLENTRKLFSKKDTADLKKTNEWLLSSKVNYEFVQKYFSPIERFRSIEFERDWNRTTPAIQNDQHIANLLVGLQKPNKGVVYQLNSFTENEFYSGLKHNLNTKLHEKGFRFDFDGSYLTSTSTVNNTSFLRSRAQISQSIKGITVGLRELQEINKLNYSTDSLLFTSYRFFEWEAFISNSDTSKNKFMIGYKERKDDAVITNSFKPATFAKEIRFVTELLKNKKQQFRGTITHRSLELEEAASINQKPDNTLLARIEHDSRMAKGAITTNTFYEIGSGLEQKKQFSYLKVASGQGVYDWIDFNNDSIAQLNEFEVAAFTDRANYIKIFTPTDDYIKTFSNQFSHILNLKPAAIWNNKKGWRKTLAYFSNITAYRVERKTTDDRLKIAYNPLLKEAEDTALASLTSSLRNTIFFNQTGPVFGGDFTWQDNRNKVLLTNGFDLRVNSYKELRIRWNINKSWDFTSPFREGKKKNTSEFFSTRNYNIHYYETEPKLSFQPNQKFRLSAISRYSTKDNSMELGNEKATIQSNGLETRYNVLNKGSLNAQFNYILINYNGDQNTSLAYEMLEGLKPGKNYTWQLSYQRNLSGSIQLNITYEGRKSPENKTIHTGGAEVKAFF